MYFAVHCIDRENSTKLRQDTRPAHLEYMKTIEDSLVLAGPYLNQQGDSIGSLLIFEAQTEDDVRRMVENDPYAGVNLFAKVDVLPWRWVINPPN